MLWTQLKNDLKCKTVKCTNAKIHARQVKTNLKCAKNENKFSEMLWTQLKNDLKCKNHYTQKLC